MGYTAPCAVPARRAEHTCRNLADAHRDSIATYPGSRVPRQTVRFAASVRDRWQKSFPRHACHECCSLERARQAHRLACGSPRCHLGRARPDFRRLLKATRDRSVSQVKNAQVWTSAHPLVKIYPIEPRQKQSVLRNDPSTKPRQYLIRSSNPLSDRIILVCKHDDTQFLTRHKRDVSRKPVG
jgi:hypothetical protein